MMTSSNGNIFRVTGPLCGEFTGPGEFPTQRPVTRSFDVFFDLRLNKRLSKQPWGWSFETPSWSLWRRRNALDSWMFTTLAISIFIPTTAATAMLPLCYSLLNLGRLMLARCRGGRSSHRFWDNDARNTTCWPDIRLRPIFVTSNT